MTLLDPSDAETTTTESPSDPRAVMAALEGLIRRCPTQYLWLHQRFKRQPDGSKRRYG